jgi:predicted RNA binding protein YcfA (HicA-like mRNA interferase family)
MPKLAPVKTIKFVKFLLEVGCVERMSCDDHGSHKFFTRTGLLRPITVVMSNKEVPKEHIKKTLKVLDISEENFLIIIKTIKG